MKRKLPIVSLFAALVTLVIGILVLIGWMIHTDFLGLVVSGAVRMKFNTALGFLFSSIVLLLNCFSGKTRTLHFVTGLLSVIISLTGFLTLTEYIFSYNLGIDELFIKDETGTTGIYYAGRMSVWSAINFLLTGIGLLLLNKEKAATYQFFYLSGMAFISLMMLIGFNFITDIPAYFRISIPSAVGFISLAIACWFAQPILLKKISFERKLFTVFSAAIILTVVITLFSSKYSAKRIRSSKLVHHTTNVLNETEQILSLVKDIESGGRGYIITGDSSYLEYFTIAKNTVFIHVKALKEFTKENPAQQVTIDSLADLVAKRIRFSLNCIQVRNTKGAEAANKLMASRQGKFYTDKIRYITAEIREEETGLLTRWETENAKSVLSFNRAYDVLFVSIFILLAIILFSIRNYFTTRKKTEATLTKLNNELEQRVKERTEEIYKNEKRFRAFIEHSSDIIFLLDESFKIFYRSPSASRITGWTDADMKGSDGIKNIHPDDKEKNENILRELLTNPGKPITCVLRNLHKDGHYLWLEGVVVNLLQDEQVKAIVFNFRDVTERVAAEEKLIQSEEKYRTIFYKSPLPNLVYDPETLRFLEVNEAAVRHYGYTQEEFLSMGLRDIRPKEDEELLLNDLLKIQPGPDSRQGTSRHLKKNGDISIVETTAYSIDYNNRKARLVIVNDITEKLKAEQELRISHDRLSFHIENAPLGFIESDKQLQVKNWSRRAEEIFGWSEEEFISLQKEGYNLAYEEDRPLMNKIVERLITGKEESNSLQQRNHTKDGRVIWCEWFNSVLKDKDGKVITILSLVQDITERKNAEQELLQNQMRLNQSQEIVHMGNWEVNFETNTSKWSDEAYRIYGLSPGDHGLSIDEWMSFVHPDDIDYVKKELEKSQATLSNSAFHHRIVRKDGVIRYIYSESKFEFNNEGRPIGLYGIAHDVTESKKAEEYLRQSEMRLNEAQAIAHISNWEIDLVQNVHTWSDEYYRIYGLNKGEVQPSAEFFLSYMHPDDVDFAQKKMQEAFISLNDSSFEFRFIRKDGATRYGCTEWKFEFDKKGNPIRLFGILQDITERKEAEENLKSLEKKILEQKIQQQKKIARAILNAQEKERNHLGQELHDNINQILVGAKLYLGSAGNKNETIKPLIKYPLELIDSSIEEMRLLSSKLVTPLKNINMEDLVQELLSKPAQNTLIKTNFTYALSNESISDDLKLNIYRVLQEQINNILKYAEAKNITVSIKTEGSNINIIVSDDGKGFDVKSKRSGIGISNMMNRIESFNGKIDIESSAGNGCKIQISIPY